MFTSGARSVTASLDGAGAPRRLLSSRTEAKGHPFFALERVRSRSTTWRRSPIVMVASDVDVAKFNGEATLDILKQGGFSLKQAMAVVSAIRVSVQPLASEARLCSLKAQVESLKADVGSTQADLRALKETMKADLVALNEGMKATKRLLFATLIVLAMCIALLVARGSFATDMASLAQKVLTKT